MSFAFLSRPCCPGWKFLFSIPHDGLASLAFQKKLHSFSAAQPADRSNISSQLNSPSLRRTATVVRNRSHVANSTHFESRRLQGPDRRIPSGSGSFHVDLERAHSRLTGAVRRRERGLLGGERCSFPRTLETKRSGA